MNWTGFQRLALAAFIAVEALIFVGAVVRATGSGLGCPDWPFCYGCWLPPTKAEDIDFSKINIEKFRAKAARLGRDPATITVESLRAGFDPVATWVEYINRLTSLPAGLTVAALFIASFGQLRQKRPAVFVAAAAALGLVLFNAWLGARVVLSGLKPGVITLHMALAVLLQCVLVFAAWRGTASPWRLQFSPVAAGPLRRVALLLLALVVIEGVMGSQVREMTDRLAMLHADVPRREWISDLEGSTVYLVHRSFSWFVLGAGFWWASIIWNAQTRLHGLERAVILLVVAQMLLGLVLSQVGITRPAQVLHIGLSSLLVSGLFLWLLGSRRADFAGGSGADAALR